MPDPINGTQEGDELYGTAVGEIINGLGGIDEIHGGGGNDIINGGAEKDYLFGDGGQDTILGGAGQDEIDGGGDIDFIADDEGYNTIHGGEGGDQIYASGKVFGDGGNDYISAQYGSVEGGQGNDTLVMTTAGEHVSMTGGLDADTFRIEEGDAFIFDFDVAEGDKLQLAEADDLSVRAYELVRDPDQVGDFGSSWGWQIEVESESEDYSVTLWLATEEEVAHILADGFEMVA